MGDNILSPREYIALEFAKILTLREGHAAIVDDDNLDRAINITDKLIKKLEETKPKELHLIHNPKNVLILNLEPHLGYRFLDIDEIKERQNRSDCIEGWDSNIASFKKTFKGSDHGATYRTRLSREELAKLT